MNEPHKPLGLNVEIIRCGTPSYELWRQNQLTDIVWRILEATRNLSGTERACTIAREVTRYYAELIIRNEERIRREGDA